MYIQGETLINLSYLILSYLTLYVEDCVSIIMMLLHIKVHAINTTVNTRQQHCVIQDNVLTQPHLAPPHPTSPHHGLW